LWLLCPYQCPLMQSPAPHHRIQAPPLLRFLREKRLCEIQSIIRLHLSVICSTPTSIRSRHRFLCFTPRWLCPFSEELRNVARGRRQQALFSHLLPSNDFTPSKPKASSLHKFLCAHFPNAYFTFVVQWQAHHTISSHSNHFMFTHAAYHRTRWALTTKCRRAWG
jgi:hypothetical protein